MTAPATNRHLAAVSRPNPDTAAPDMAEQAPDTAGAPRPVGFRPLPYPLVDVDPGAAAAELVAMIEARAARHPRSLQTAIGPSEIGSPCDRKLGHKLAGTPAKTDTAWWQVVGTAIHAHLEQWFADTDPADYAAHIQTWARGLNHTWPDLLGGHPRFYTEPELYVGTVGGQPITGHSDLYDRLTAISWDWKLQGPTSLRTTRQQGPSATYRTQAHLYGLGWENAGMPIRHVGIMCLPRNGVLGDHVAWTEPYDRQHALDALTRLNSISYALDLFGTDALAVLPRADDYCESCPFHRPRIETPETGCPGATPDTGARSHPSGSGPSGTDQILDLI